MVSVAPNVPFGIAFVGRRWSEETLIKVAYAFEQRTMVRKRVRPLVAPKFELSDLYEARVREQAVVMHNDTSTGYLQKSVPDSLRETSMMSFFSSQMWISSFLKFVSLGA